MKKTDGYATISSLAEFNGTIDPEKWPQGLFSFTTCLRCIIDFVQKLALSNFLLKI